MQATTPFSVTALPDFSAIHIDSLEQQLTELLAQNNANIDTLLAELTAPSWQNFVAKIEEWSDQLNAFWSPISHLHSVKNSPELREVYNQCQPKLTAYYTELGQNKALFEAYQQLAKSDEYQALTIAQKKIIDNALRDFKLSGIHLEGQPRERYAAIQQRLAELSTKFSNNVLDATQAWYIHLEEVAELAGVPESSLSLYAQAAKAKHLSGYVISLEIPSYLPVMQYAENRSLRESLYRAYAMRASELGLALEADATDWDNSALIDEILALRYELAQLLGFENYAECSLATKMAEDCQQVLSFLTELAEQSRAVGEQDYAELKAFAAESGLDGLEAWDIPYYSEKLRLEKYALSQQEVREYFPVDKVIEGMFGLVNRLFAIEVEEQTAIDAWHPDARLFTVKKQGKLIAKFYFDLFARENKRGGAWMADCRVRRIKADGNLQLPVAFLVCNFTPPSENLPSLLTHNEVTTLFHEFGHGLHHMLTAIDYADVSGINGVAWDAVELPSQFLENWCWEKPALMEISAHYQTGEPLPDALLEKMLAAKNFQSGMFMMRQLEFALFDFSLHMQKPGVDVQALLNGVRDKTALYPVPEFNRFQHSFTHIFAGGYAAGYYSYKWAEVLSADAFSRFEEEGIFNAETGQAFLHCILERGGSEEPMALFEAFRGRKPSTEALLRHSGIVTTKVA